MHESNLLASSALHTRELSPHEMANAIRMLVICGGAGRIRPPRHAHWHDRRYNPIERTQDSYASLNPFYLYEHTIVFCDVTAPQQFGYKSNLQRSQFSLERSHGQPPTNVVAIS